MPVNLRFGQFINAIVIGVLFQVGVLLLLVAFFGRPVIAAIGQLPAALLSALVVILSFPCWRFVSNYVEQLMYLEESDPGVRRFFARVFFGISPADKDATADAVRRMLDGSCGEVYAKFPQRVREVFDIDTGRLDEAGMARLYGLIRFHVDLHSTERALSRIEQANAVQNFHYRLAIVAFLQAVLSLGLSVAALVAPMFGIYAASPIWVFLALGVVGIFFSRHFGARAAELDGRESTLVATAFMALGASHQRGQPVVPRGQVA